MDKNIQYMISDKFEKGIHTDDCYDGDSSYISIFVYFILTAHVSLLFVCYA